MSYDNVWESLIYSQKKHINKYPYGELVSVFFNSLKFLPEKLRADRSLIKVLEIGCGAGNNLWFINELGCQVYGVDGSKTACEIAKNNLRSRGAEKVEIQHAYFDDLPYESNSVDILIDRESTCCGSYSDIKKWWSEANRVLKSGGVVISFKFSDKSPDLLKIKSGLIDAIKIENNTYRAVTEGTFKDTGTIHFSTYDELVELFDFINIKYINMHDSKTVYAVANNQYNYSEWIVVGVKK